MCRSWPRHVTKPWLQLISQTRRNLQKGSILQLQNLLKSARSAVSCVERACEQIRCSDRLAHVLSRVLATGNVLNADTHRGNALAIRLDSLSKMSDVKVSPDIGLERAQ